jgi:hypothetical protein
MYTKHMRNYNGNNEQFQTCVQKWFQDNLGIIWFWISRELHILWNLLIGIQPEPNNFEVKEFSYYLLNCLEWFLPWYHWYYIQV